MKKPQLLQSHDNDATTGRYLRLTRETWGYTQHEVAAACGLHPKTVQRAELGRATASTYAAIAHALMGCILANLIR